MISDRAVACPKCGCPVEPADVEPAADVQAEPADPAPVEADVQQSEYVKEEESNYQKEEKTAHDETPKQETQTPGTQSSSGVSGASAAANPYLYKAKKDKVVAAVLAFFLGGLGIHHFYLGNNERGVSYLVAYFVLSIAYIIFSVVTFGVGMAIPLPIVMSIISIIDMVHYLQDNEKDFDARIEREVDPIWKKIMY